MAEPIELEGQQKALHEALVLRSESLANMHLGALTVLSDEANPDRIALAAHDFRELMEKIPLVLDFPTRVSSVSLKEKSQGLHTEWTTVSSRSHCRNDEGWSGEIDGPLRRFLQKVEEFFNWFLASHPIRRIRIAEMLRGFDPTANPLPETLEELRVAEWGQIWDYFVRVAHHGPVSEDEFPKWIAAFEAFLLERLIPRTFEDFDTIDTIVDGGAR